MWLLVIGAAVGALVVVLLRALNQFESSGLVGVHGEIEHVLDRLSEAEERIEALEAIAAAEPSITHDLDLEEEDREAMRPRTRS